jgi:acetyltransferase-like isoleucine patch superfamily enzyme
MLPDKIRYVFYVKCCDNYDVFSTGFFRGTGTKVYGEGTFVVGENSYCGERCGFQLAVNKGIYIGNNTSISHNVRVYTSNQSPVDIINENDSINIKSGDVYIGNNCWIGANVFIKEGVKVGDFVVVGANSVVSKDVPSNSIAAGAPIKILKKKVKI